MDYRDKRILAPMVRVGTLPTRLLAASYGADIVYTEELIDKRLMHCTRVENAAVGTVDFVDKKGVLLLSTLESERHRTVAQIGTSAPDLALASASLVSSEVAAIDVNMGCPLPFSVLGGMGSALLKKPDTARDILTTLRRNLPNAISCKIRLLGTREATVELAKVIEHCHVDALAVHGRYVSERPRDPAHWEEIALVASALSIPVIANGDVYASEDWERIQTATGAAAVMCGRGAMWNASIFRREGGMLPPEVVRRAYVEQAVRVQHSAGNAKYNLRQNLIPDVGLEGPEGKALNQAKTLEAIAAIYGVGAGRVAGDRAADMSSGALLGGSVVATEVIL